MEKMDEKVGEERICLEWKSAKGSAANYYLNFINTAILSKEVNCHPFDGQRKDK